MTPSNHTSDISIDALKTLDQSLDSDQGYDRIRLPAWLIPALLIVLSLSILFKNFQPGLVSFILHGTVGVVISLTYYYSWSSARVVNDYAEGYFSSSREMKKSLQQMRLDVAVGKMQEVSQQSQSNFDISAFEDLDGTVLEAPKPAASEHEPEAQSRPEPHVSNAEKKFPKWFFKRRK